MTLKCNLIVDLSNLAWISRYSLVKNNELTKELILHGIISIIKSSACRYKVDGILVACDSKNNWRKDIYPEYKGNRNKEKDEYFIDVVDAIQQAEEFFNTCTNIPAIKVDNAEADDIIAISTKTSKHKTVILSSDKDFIQLLDDKTRLYSPTTKNERKTFDRDFDLFVKCIRGDPGDNIHAAYPRVRTKRLQEVWGDKLKMANLMEEKRKIDGKKVGNFYEFNRRLIDLDQIPQGIQYSISQQLETISDSNSYGRYSHMKILRYLGKNNLRKIAKEERMFSSIFKKRYII
jgi:5'-3' exonuclease, N-terminal resolvase-like domain/T4 RNase H, C terminal